MSDLSPEQRERDTQMIQDFADKLGEHFDSVNIIVTKDYNNQCWRQSRGSGSTYARLGSTRLWLIAEEERTRARSFLDVKEDAENGAPPDKE